MGHEGPVVLSAVLNISTRFPGVSICALHQRRVSVVTTEPLWHNHCNGAMIDNLSHRFWLGQSHIKNDSLVVRCIGTENLKVSDYIVISSGEYKI